jgi:hypothetical protein
VLPLRQAEHFFQLGREVSSHCGQHTPATCVENRMVSRTPRDILRTADELARDASSGSARIGLPGWGTKYAHGRSPSSSMRYTKLQRQGTPRHSIDSTTPPSVLRPSRACVRRNECCLWNGVRRSSAPGCWNRSSQAIRGFGAFRDTSTSEKASASAYEQRTCETSGQNPTVSRHISGLYCWKVFGRFPLPAVKVD